MDKSELEIGEPHPSAHSAKQWLIEKLGDFKYTFALKESLASSAISGNRLAEVCLGTLNRLLNSEPVSDRYLLGFAWFLRDLEGEKGCEHEWIQVYNTELPYATHSVSPAVCKFCGATNDR